jgi:hypothetical protein
MKIFFTFLDEDKSRAEDYCKSLSEESRVCASSQKSNHEHLQSKLLRIYLLGTFHFTEAAAKNKKSSKRKESAKEIEAILKSKNAFKKSGAMRYDMIVWWLFN